MRDLKARVATARALAVVAALLLVGSQFATVVSVDVAGGSCEALNDTDPTLAERCVQGGFERHGPAFALLAAAVLAMALWATRSRAAGLGLVAIGAVALGIVLFGDLPASRESGVIGRDYSGAEAQAGAAIWLEAAGGALAVLAGLLVLMPGPSRSQRTAGSRGVGGEAGKDAGRP